MNLLGHTIAVEATGCPFLIIGPGVIDSEAVCLVVAQELRRLADRTGTLVIFRADLAQAGMTGRDESLRVLEKVRSETGLPVLAAVAQAAQVAAVAHVADMLETPASLAHRAELVAAAAASGRPVNLGRAPTLTTAEMARLVGRARTAARAAGHADAVFTIGAGGTTSGTGRPMLDVQTLVELRETGCPVVFDTTPSGSVHAGSSQHWGAACLPSLARAAVAVGVAGLALTTLPDMSYAALGPASAAARHAVPLAQLPDLAEGLLRLADGAALAAAPAQAPLFAWHRRQPPLPATMAVD